MGELKKQRFDMVLSDYQMPKMNGVDLLALVKENHPDTKRVLITGLSDMVVAQDAMRKAKVHFFLEKPVDKDVLRGTIHELLKASRVEPTLDDTGATPATETQSTMAPGNMYLIEERKGAKAFEVLTDLIERGHQGLAITTQSPDMIKQRYGLGGTSVRWLSKREVDGAMDANNLVELGFLIREFLEPAERGVVLLDGFDYLTSIHGFDKTIKFLQDLSEFIVYSNKNVIIPLNPQTLSAQQYAILGRYLESLE
jgi:CheY-like chemotaxis protein